MLDQLFSSPEWLASCCWALLVRRLPSEKTESSNGESTAFAQNADMTFVQRPIIAPSVARSFQDPCEEGKRASAGEVSTANEGQRIYLGTI
jgi:hypothetical protein